MAAVSIPPSPHAIGTMAGRRAPLSNLPNAGNSPYRAISNVTKGSRSQNTTVDVPPPSKRKIVECEETTPATPRKRTGLAVLESVASRHERAAASRATREQKTEKIDSSLEKLAAWQNHYRPAFPSYVFYFENVSDDLRRQFVRRIKSFGGRQEEFFSKDVTHIITTRALPAESDTAQHELAAAQQASQQPQTINPSLLEKNTDQLNGIPRAKFTFEPTLSKRVTSMAEVEGRKSSNFDILLKAREMQMKIWQVEKLNRFLNCLDEPTSPQEASFAPLVQRTAQNSRTARQPNLSQMIKNEQMNGPGEREASLVGSELVLFKGPHIYVRDMNEKTKPIMVREYPKVQNREDGEWPQFRSVTGGKCPFVDEDLHARLKEKKGLKKKVAEQDAVKKRNAVASRMEPPTYAGRKRPLAEVEHHALQNALQLPAHSPEATARTKADANARGTSLVQGMQGREPMASGLQASTITSAIRSQMISSTAAGPGAKAGTSREIHGLQRKVLERNNSGPATGSLVHSRRMADLAGAARFNTRAAKTKAQEKFGMNQIHEDEQDTEGVESRPQTSRAASKASSKEKKDLKPGYCENCREKFDDFEEHVKGKQHRKFAISKENWKDLDGLLSLLERPLRGMSDTMDEDFL